MHAAVPDDGILVSGITQLGYAYPTALGAKVAQPDRPVVALCGDGGFLFNSQELAPALIEAPVGMMPTPFT